MSLKNLNSAEVEFARQIDRAVAQQGGPGRIRSLIEKELLHCDILLALEQGGFLNQGLVFQGGISESLARTISGEPTDRFADKAAPVEPIELDVVMIYTLM